MKHLYKQINFQDFNFSYLIIPAGLILSLVQFLTNRSLSVDEAALAISIVNRDATGLLKPLEFNQVAPILYLQIEKLFSNFLANTDYSLRIFPLTGFWISLLLFYRILKRYFRQPEVIAFGIALFAFNSVLIYYSSEVKQYMSDVMVTLIMTGILIEKKMSANTKNFWLGLAGSVAIFLSNIAPIILASIGIYLIAVNLSKGKLITRGQLLVFAFWTFTFLIYYLFFIYGHPARAYMLNYWGAKTGFAPINPFQKSTYVYFFLKLKMLFTELLKFGKSGFLIFPVLSILGLINLAQNKKFKLALLLLSPIVLHATLSMIHLYPLYRRLVLYLAPIIILIITFGFQFVIQKSKIYKFPKIFKSLTIVLVMGIFAIFIQNGFPINRQEVKTAIQHIQENRTRDDKIYIHWFAKYQFMYYYYTGLHNLNNDPNLILGEKSERFNYSKEINEIEHNGKIWMMYLWYADQAQNYLDSLQYEQLDKIDIHGGELMLYNFVPKSDHSNIDIPEPNRKIIK